MIILTAFGCLFLGIHATKNPPSNSSNDTSQIVKLTFYIMKLNR